MNDLFHILDLSGILLNKAEPDDSDTRPFDEFMRYAKTMTVAAKPGGDVEVV